MSFGGPSGSAGVIAIVGACVAVSCLITWVTGSYTHWILVIAGINPKTGDAVPLGSAANTGVKTFSTPDGWEDALLVLEAYGNNRAANTP